MFLCKNKFFKKLLLFSSVFMVLSFFYYKITCANTTSTKKISKLNQVNQIITQQREIIVSLKKIEDRMVIKNESNKQHRKN